MSHSRVSFARPLHARLVLLWGVVLAMVLPLAAMSPAQAAKDAANAPYLQLTESTAIAAETVKATGKLPGVYSRPILVQRKSAAGWATLAEATTSATGAYATSFSAPDVGTYKLRVMASRITVARHVRAEYVSAAKTLLVVAQTAFMSMPTTLVESETGTASVKFGPARVGRPVTLEVMTSGAWTAIATGAQSSTGTASLMFATGAPGTYSYRARTAAANGAPAFTSPVGVLKVIAAAPGPVTNVTAIPSSTSIALSWDNPIDPSLSGVMIRRALGATPPGSATTGSLVTDAAKPASSFVDTALPSGTQYSYALFAYDVKFRFATAGTVTTTTTAVGVLPSITGTVVEAGPNPHGLANVRVSVNSNSTGGYANVTTIVDGTYAVSGLPAGTDYTVCFYGADGSGGSSDALGYLHQCFDNVPMMGEPLGGDPTPVTVAAGATTTAVDAALLVGGAISGIVSDAEGTQHGLANVRVSVSTPSNGNYYGDASTAADGSYTVKGMPAGTDYQVCFLATGATGASADSAGYLDQCYNNQPTSGTPTAVAVALGSPSVGVDAALSHAGAISGTVSEVGTQHRLAKVSVSVSSPSTGTYTSSTTAPDGSYIASGLPAATDYQVCFYASGATGGSADSTGYLDQCYDNQPTTGTPTPVTVALGATETGINVALATGGAISGMVSEEGGTHHGLANVSVQVSSPSLGFGGYSTTAADGTYSVTGLAAATDYTVCFSASGATGGSSDALGYLDQCYDNQPMSGTPTPVTVTLGATRAGINAALGSGAP